METLDFNSIDEDLIDLRDDYLIQIADKAFVRDEFDYRRWQMDLALKQEFLDRGLASGDWTNYNLNEDIIGDLTGKDIEELQNMDADSYSDLYVPLLLKFFRAYLVNMSNLCFPANGDWLNVTRGFSKYFYQNGVEKFLPFVNDAWVDIVKTENQRFGCKNVYKTSMAEVISYGNTCVGHNYNPDLHYIEPFTPGIGQAGIYPICDDWRKSNLCFYYDINYSELLGRDDFDQEIIEQIEPQTVGTDSSTLAGSGSTTIHDHYRNTEPFGKVRLYDFFLPSVYLRGKDNKKFVAKNVYVTAVIQPHIDPQSELETRKLYVLKATQNVNPVDHGLLYAAFSTNLPGVFYSQGPLQPFLPHQYTANQFFSEISRTVGMVTDPPKTITATGGGMIDPVETPIPEFEAGAEYENMVVNTLINPTDASNSLSVYLNYMNYFNSVLEEGTGISKAQMGSMHQGRKTATEIKESYSGSQLNVVEAAGQFDVQVLRRSIICRINATQNILRVQIEQDVQSVMEENPSIQDEGEAYEVALLGNELFNRLLNYSGIEASYENFYKKTQGDIIEDQTIMQEVQQMSQQIQQMIAFADSPPVPPPPIQQREVPDPNNPEKKITVPPAAEITGLQQQWLQSQAQQKEQARMQAKQLETEMKIKALTFGDVKEPPPPNNRLFFEMLTAPITDSDVVVTGSMTTISKELARENLLMLLNALQGFPQEAVMKVDFDGILQMLARSNDVALRDMLKNETQLLREEEAQKKEQLRMQQLQDMAAQGKPGSQPPQFG